MDRYVTWAGEVTGENCISIEFGDDSRMVVLCWEKHKRAMDMSS